MVRELTPEEVEFTIELRPEHTSLEGNCSAIDDETDRETEEWIQDQLERGNYWAWTMVKVTAKWEGFEGHDYLGCCSYQSEEDFKVGGYWDDMKQQALDDLNRQVAEVAGQVQLLEDSE